MARGEATQNKLHYKGRTDDFVLFIDDVEEYNKWKTDKSVPIAQFLSAFKVFVTHKQGAQGMFDTASKSSLDAEFDTESHDDAIMKILEAGGELQSVEGPGRQGPKNDSMNSMNAR